MQEDMKEYRNLMLQPQIGKRLKWEEKESLEVVTTPPALDTEPAHSKGKH